MARLILVRHGQSEWNAQGRVQGHAGGGLSALGAAQAKATAAFLARAHPQIALIARSDLPRVVETAAPLEALVDAPVHVDQRLRELDVGSWAGKTRDELVVRDPAGVAGWLRGEDIPCERAETFAALRERAWTAVCDIGGRTGEGVAVVVTHGGAIRAVLAALLALPPRGERLLAPVANCSLSEVLLGDAPRLVAYNRVGHLAQM